MLSVGGVFLLPITQVTARLRHLPDKIAQPHHASTTTFTFMQISVNIESSRKIRLILIRVMDGWTGYMANSSHTHQEFAEFAVVVLEGKVPPPYSDSAS